MLQLQNRTKWNKIKSDKLQVQEEVHMKWTFSNPGVGYLLPSFLLNENECWE